MLEIILDGEHLDLPSGFSMQIEETNPIFNERGSQSLPATVPASGRNARLLGHPHRLDTATEPNNPLRNAVVADGMTQRRGSLNVTEAGRREGYTFNVGFDNAEVYAKWLKKKLAKLDGLPVRLPKSGYRDVHELLAELTEIYHHCDSQSEPLAIFPVAINCEEHEDEKYWEILNVLNNGSLEQPTKVNRILNGEVTETVIPAGYCVSPFVRAWKVLELIFADMGLTIVSNPLKEDVELSRLVVLNNAADSVCLGEIRYADLMPDCTVQEFLNSLWVRFGLVYNVNFDTGNADVRLLRDILRQEPATHLDRYMTGWPKVTYGSRQYIKLSAQSSLEGAAPATERFEDFVKGLDLTELHLGKDLSEWQHEDQGGGGGDKPSGYWPDGGKHLWDKPDDFQVVPPVMVENTPGLRSRADGDTSECFLCRTFRTAMWYKLDNTNRKVTGSSTSFFNWDPQTEGLEPMELQSDDEWVPVEYIASGKQNTGWYFFDYAPKYLVKARHYHSYIKNSGDDDGDSGKNDGDSTPLAFMLAYQCGNYTAGHFCPEDKEGAAESFPDGSVGKLSLLFQFADGLFANFWKEYDELLRHDNRACEVETGMPKALLSSLNLFSVATCNGVRCLIDKASYTLPSASPTKVALTLRPIEKRSGYDIAEEQGVPTLKSVSRELKWQVTWDAFDQDDFEGTLSEYPEFAVREWLDANDYRPHDGWYVDRESMELVSKERVGVWWENDPEIPKPTQLAENFDKYYRMTATYDVYEVRWNEDDPELPFTERAEIPIGRIVCEWEYHVIMTSRWF